MDMFKKLVTLTDVQRESIKIVVLAKIAEELQQMNIKRGRI